MYKIKVFLSKLLNYINTRLYINEIIVIYSLKNYQPQTSVATIKHATYENIKDVLYFQTHKYIDIFKNFLSLDDKGYLAYLQGKLFIEVG